MATTSKMQSTSVPKGNQVFLFDKGNYIWMIGGVALMLIGLVIMAGGKSPDPHKFNYDDIYSPMRITVAPILMILGMIVEVFAIMKKPSVTATDASE